jgi:hypothetical protein
LPSIDGSTLEATKHRIFNNSAMKNMTSYKSGPKFYREIEMLGARTKGSLTGKGEPAGNGEDR